MPFKLGLPSICKDDASFVDLKLAKTSNRKSLRSTSVQNINFAEKTYLQDSARRCKVFQKRSYKLTPLEFEVGKSKLRAAELLTILSENG